MNKSLTSKQVFKISLIISGIYLICNMLTVILSNLNGDDLFFGIIYAFIGTGVVLLFFYFFVFKGEDRIFNEEYEELKKDIAKKLPKDEVVEIYYIPQLTGSEKDMILDILSNVSCKFYAKILENGNICVTATNNKAEQIYTAEIENYRCFESIFSLNNSAE